jgi:hypothetical protein
MRGQWRRRDRKTGKGEQSEVEPGHAQQLACRGGPVEAGTGLISR